LLSEELKLNKPTFEIHQDELGKYRYRIRASNNKIITIGEGCNTRNECMNGIMDVKERIKKYHDSEIKDFTKGETILLLNKLNDNIRIGSRITFSGRLFGDVSGEGIERARISIYESDGAILKESPIASGYTSILGSFNIDWVVKKMDWWDNSIELYAKFQGEVTLKPSSSKKQKILIS
jgi:uncharacterized protein YegP (UPF0339 family)